MKKSRAEPLQESALNGYFCFAKKQINQCPKVVISSDSRYMVS